MPTVVAVLLLVRRKTSQKLKFWRLQYDRVKTTTNKHIVTNLPTSLVGNNNNIDCFDDFFCTLLCCYFCLSVCLSVCLQYLYLSAVFVYCICLSICLFVCSLFLLRIFDVIFFRSFLLSFAIFCCSTSSASD